MQASALDHAKQLTEKLNMQRVAAKFVPCVLTEDQKANRVNISQELLDRVNVDENFLKPP